MRQTFLQQFFPIFLTILTFFALSALLYNFIAILNLFPISSKIIPQVRLADILIGLTIYVKTSVDFAIFIGNLMATNPGWKNRIAIELGTALGNAAGTLFVLIIWTFFKEVPVLMILMIFLASIVLLGMAEDGLNELPISQLKFDVLITITTQVNLVLKNVNKIVKPVIHVILPHPSSNTAAKRSFLLLGVFSFSVPLILGLDDFAGYIPLFSIINVFGFSLGVFLGHMLLNIALFASPTQTVRIVRQPLIILFGSIAFIGIAVWGFVEIYHLIMALLTH